MSHATRYKYISISVNVIVILLSLSILFILYCLAGNNNNIDNTISTYDDGDDARSSDGDWRLQTTTTTTTNAANERVTLILRSIDAEDITRDDLKNNTTSLNETTTTTINSSAADVVNDNDYDQLASILLAKRSPLIVSSVVAYLLAIASCISVGLEHVPLLSLLVLLYFVISGGSLTLLVFSFLASMFESQSFPLDFLNAALLAVFLITAVQVRFCCVCLINL